MAVRLQSKFGYTIIELMVTVVIVAVLAATVGTFFVKLLTIRENEREEAYIREKLVDICGTYADMLSVGSVLSNRTDLVNNGFAVTYRQEAGGVSLETGRVSRVAQLISAYNPYDKTLHLNVGAFETNVFRAKYSRCLSGDALLIPQLGNMVSCTITPLNASSYEDAVLGYLQVAADYEIENDEGKTERKHVTAARVVRLWNRE